MRRLAQVDAGHPDLRPIGVLVGLDPGLLDHEAVVELGREGEEHQVALLEGRELGPGGGLVGQVRGRGQLDGGLVRPAPAPAAAAPRSGRS